MSTTTLILGIIFVVSGGVVLYLQIGSLKKGKASKNWPTTIGTILSSEIKLVRIKSGRRHYANVFYKYAVNGIEYSSNNFSFKSYNVAEPKNAQRIVDRYPSGKEIIVFYNPNNPGTAVIEPGTSLNDYFFTIIGFIFAGIGLYMLFKL